MRIVKTRSDIINSPLSLSCSHPKPVVYNIVCRQPMIAHILVHSNNSNITSSTETSTLPVNFDFWNFLFQIVKDVKICLVQFSCNSKIWKYLIIFKTSRMVRTIDDSDWKCWSPCGWLAEIFIRLLIAAIYGISYFVNKPFIRQIEGK